MANAYQFLGDDHRAEDVVSEAFANTLRALQRGLGPNDSFNGYLMTAVRSEAFKVSPSERATVSVSHDQLEGLSQSVEPDSAVGIAERDQLMRAFEALPEDWRRVLYLIEVAGEPPVVAAQNLEVSVSATNALLFRAREGLRTTYLQQYVERAQPQCEGIAPALGRFVRGGLRAQKKTKVVRHLQGCSACSAQLHRLRLINENLRGWVGPAAAGIGLAGAASFGGSGSAGAAALTGSGAVGASTVVAAKPGLALKIWIGATVGVAVAATAVVLWPSAEAPAPAAPAPPVEIVTPEPTPNPEPAPEPEPPPQPEPEPPSVIPEPPAPEPPALLEDDDSPNWVEIE
ncbi:sigma-70 family RNA polymerase sigma factor [Leucobacter viscericola]|uniref:Sigma-70 family RNA polymerase sigma factor n=1 Tax=Leucobacter viscericola TaxID=2714935 RepID=A0A6G7XHI5_9MICO|nr:sigma-70 family RNA polymerase sigma factor [Leucobacter viscericola]